MWSVLWNITSGGTCSKILMSMSYLIATAPKEVTIAMTLYETQPTTKLDWLAAPKRVYRISDAANVKTFLSSCLELGRTYIVAKAPHAQGRSLSVAHKIGAFGILQIDTRAECQRTADVYRAASGETFCDAVEIDDRCLDAWSTSLSKNFEILGRNVQLVVDIFSRIGEAKEVSNPQMERLKKNYNLFHVGSRYRKFDIDRFFNQG